VEVVRMAAAMAAGDMAAGGQVMTVVSTAAVDLAVVEEALARVGAAREELVVRVVE
jgi:hypothetical protein